MPDPTAPILPEIALEHFEQLASLWNLWQDAVRSPEYKLEDLEALEERIEAHVDALLLALDRVRPLLEGNLASDDAPQAFAAAYVLLRSNREDAARKVMDAFRDAEEGQVDGLRSALCQASISKLIDDLKEAFVSPPAWVAVAAAQVLAVHSLLDSNSGRLTELFADENPGVREAAWRVAAILDSHENAGQ